MGHHEMPWHRLRRYEATWDNMEQQAAGSKFIVQKISNETAWDSMRRHGRDTDSKGQGETPWDIESRSGSFLHQWFTEGRAERRL